MWLWWKRGTWDGPNNDISPYTLEMAWTNALSVSSLDLALVPAEPWWWGYTLAPNLDVPSPSTCCRLHVWFTCCIIYMLTAAFTCCSFAGCSLQVDGAGWLQVRSWVVREKPVPRLRAIIVPEVSVATLSDMKQYFFAWKIFNDIYLYGIWNNGLNNCQITYNSTGFGQSRAFFKEP